MPARSFFSAASAAASEPSFKVETNDFREAALQAAGEGFRRSGWMKKKGQKNTLSVVRRWFVMNKNNLFYYTSDTDLESVVGMIWVEGAFARASSSEDDDRDGAACSLWITTLGNRQIELRCDTNEDRDGWVASLNQGHWGHMAKTKAAATEDAAALLQEKNEGLKRIEDLASQMEELGAALDEGVRERARLEQDRLSAKREANVLLRARGLKPFDGLSDTANDRITNGHHTRLRCWVGSCNLGASEPLYGNSSTRPISAWYPH